MVSLYEMFFYAVHNWGEKTPKTTFNIDQDKKWPVMKDSNILTRDEGIETFDTEKIKVEK